MVTNGLAIVISGADESDERWAPLLAACLSDAPLLNSTPRIWIALSGGADSTALLLAVLRLGLATPVSVTHIDHGVQSDSKRWAESCAELCKRLEVPLHIHRVTPPPNGRFPNGFEAWARAQRYGHWQHLLDSGELLLCAHHADDQAETVGLRLLQGRLPLPMPRSRALGRGTLLRPLLGLRGKPLRQALDAAGQRWLEDPSNQDTRLLRNKVRRLLPNLQSLQDQHQDQGDWSAALLRCGTLVERQQRALRLALGQGDSLLNTLPDAGELARLALDAIPGATALQAVLALVDSGPVSRGQVSNALARLREQAAAGDTGGSARGGLRIGRPVGRDKSVLATQQTPQQPALHTEELRLFVDGRELVIWREPVFTPLPLPASGHQHINLPHGTLEVLFADSVSLGSTATAAGAGPCIVRPLAPADRLLHRGRLRPVKELLRASNVPRWARPSYPVVVANNVVLAVPAALPAAGETGGDAHGGPGLAVNGWLRDGETPDTPSKLTWMAKLPS